jgi:hypothetical protein
MKYIITENQYNPLIFEIITHMFEPHEELKSKKHPKSIFWVKNGEVIAKIQNLEYFLVSNKIWKDIMIEFSFDFDKTQQVLKDWSEEHYGLGDLTPDNMRYSSHYKTDE